MCRVDNKKAVHCSLQDFINRGNGFTKAHLSNLHIDNPIRYWESHFNSEHHDELARFAVRILIQVASERAFSTMNLIITKLRNRLSVEKANKLIFIYMNQRVLDRAGDLLLGDWVEELDEEQVEIEELLLPIEEEEENDIELDEERQEAL